MKTHEAVQERKKYEPQYNTVEDVMSRMEELEHKELVIEFSHLRFDCDYTTIDLMCAVRKVIKKKNINKKEAHEILDIVAIVAMSDVPEIENVMITHDKKTQQLIKQDLEIVKYYRKNK